MTIEDMTKDFSKLEFLIGNASLSDVELLLNFMAVNDADATKAKFEAAANFIKAINESESRPLVVGTLLRQILRGAEASPATTPATYEGFTEDEVYTMVPKSIVGIINTSDLTQAIQKTASDYVA